MANLLSNPPKKSIIYRDENVCACLAKRSLADGHTIITWRKRINDLNTLDNRSYDYLMDTVFAVREALMVTLKVKKVYLFYMDESNYVHWHLIPRYKIKGFDVFRHEEMETKNFSLAEKIKTNLFFK